MSFNRVQEIAWDPRYLKRGRIKAFRPTVSFTHIALKYSKYIRIVRGGTVRDWRVHYFRRNAQVLMHPSMNYTIKMKSSLVEKLDCNHVVVGKRSFRPRKTRFYRLLVCSQVVARNKENLEAVLEYAKNRDALAVTASFAQEMTTLMAIHEFLPHSILSPVEEVERLRFPEWMTLLA